jgi:hypothetical protein
VVVEYELRLKEMLKNMKQLEKLKAKAQEDAQRAEQERIEKERL